MNLQELAATYSAAFEARTRDNGDQFWCIKDDAPDREIIQEMAHHAHGGLLPEDYRYLFITQALDALADADDPDEAEMPEEVYTHKLFVWLASHGNRPDYVNEAAREYGLPKEKDFDIVRIVAYGYAEEQREVLSLVRQWLEEKIDELAAAA